MTGTPDVHTSLLKSVISWGRSHLPDIIQWAATLTLIYAVSRFVPDEYQLVVNLAIVALSAYVSYLKHSVKITVKSYVTKELLSALASARGIVVTESQATILGKENRNECVKEIQLGSEYVVELSLRAIQLYESPFPKSLKAVLRFSPPMFLSTTNISDNSSSRWQSELGEFLHLEDGSWSIKGTIEFHTREVAIVQQVSFSRSVDLNVDILNQDVPLFTLKLQQVPVHPIVKQEVFQELIELHILKRLPSGCHVLLVAPSHHSNLIVLSNRMLELGQIDYDRITLSIGYLVRTIFDEFQSHNRLRLDAYDPTNGAPYESELNGSEVIHRILSTIDESARVRGTGSSETRVLVCLYQTERFIETIQSGHMFGICVVGFSRQVTDGVRVIIDLDSLGSRDPNNSHHVELLNAIWLGECPSEYESVADYFQQHAPTLVKELTDA